MNSIYIYIHRYVCTHAARGIAACDVAQMQTIALPSRSRNSMRKSTRCWACWAPNPLEAARLWSLNLQKEMPTMVLAHGLAVASIVCRGIGQQHKLPSYVGHAAACIASRFALFELMPQNCCIRPRDARLAPSKREALGFLLCRLFSVLKPGPCRFPCMIACWLAIA